MAARAAPAAGRHGRKRHGARGALRPLLLAGPALLLASCGGSGGPGPTAPSAIVPPPPAPSDAIPAVTAPPAVDYNTAEYRRSAAAVDSKAITAWQAGATGKGVTIGIIDSGLSDPLGEFTGRISPASRDVTGKGRTIADSGGHGTAVAAIAAAANNGGGIVGVAHDASVVVMRADYDGCAEGCRFSDSAIAAGIDAAIGAGARVINISLGGSSANGALRQAFARAAEAGRVIVVAAGNDGKPDADPLALAALQAAGASHVIVAGAATTAGTIASFSNGAGGAANNYLLALGEGIRSFNQNGEYLFYSGTSVAAPAISAAVALLAQAFPNLSGASIVDILLNSADDAGSGSGRGLLNIGRAMAPAGSTVLAGTAIPVSMAASGSLGSAFGDGLSRAAGLQQVAVTDSYQRAYKLNLARNLTTASAGRLAARLHETNLRSADLHAASGPLRLALQLRTAARTERPAADAFRTTDAATAPLGFALRGVDLHAGERNPFREMRLQLAGAGGLALVAASGRLAGESLPGADQGGLLADDGLGMNDGSGTSGRQLLMVQRAKGPLTLAVAASKRRYQLNERNGIRHEVRQDRLTLAAAIDKDSWRLSLHAADIRDRGALFGTRLSPGFGLDGGHTRTLGAAIDYARDGYALRLAATAGRISADLGTHGLLRADGLLHSRSWSLSGTMPAGPGALSLRLAGPTTITGGSFRLANGNVVEARAGAGETTAELGYRLGPLSAFLYQRRNAGNVPGLGDQGGGFGFHRDF